MRDQRKRSDEGKVVSQSLVATFVGRIILDPFDNVENTPGQKKRIHYDRELIEMFGVNELSLPGFAFVKLFKFSSDVSDEEVLNWATKHGKEPISTYHLYGIARR
ncbi:MAG: hypothetical protein NT034_04030, partial [Candidatus Magasanikbacteria bacterium]|nr:hypothetical protein [Candidatus Magasanikbacteria bacterium]